MQAIPELLAKSKFAGRKSLVLALQVRDEKSARSDGRLWLDAFYLLFGPILLVFLWLALPLSGDEDGPQSVQHFAWLYIYPRSIITCLTGFAVFEIGLPMPREAIQVLAAICVGAVEPLLLWLLSDSVKGEEHWVFPVSSLTSGTCLMLFVLGYSVLHIDDFPEWANKKGKGGDMGDTSIEAPRQSFTDIVPVPQSPSAVVPIGDDLQVEPVSPSSTTGAVQDDGGSDTGVRPASVSVQRVSADEELAPATYSNNDSQSGGEQVVTSNNWTVPIEKAGEGAGSDRGAVKEGGSSRQRKWVYMRRQFMGLVLISFLLLVTALYTQYFANVYLREISSDEMRVLAFVIYPLPLMASSIFLDMLGDRFDANSHKTGSVIVVLQWTIGALSQLFSKQLFSNVETFQSLISIQLLQLITQVVLYPFRMTKRYHEWRLIMFHKVLKPYFPLFYGKKEPAPIEVYQKQISNEYNFVAMAQRLALISFVCYLPFLRNTWNKEYYIFAPSRQTDTAYRRQMMFIGIMSITEWLQSTIIYLIIRFQYGLDCVLDGFRWCHSSQAYKACFFIAVHILQDMYVSINLYNFA